MRSISHMLVDIARAPLWIKQRKDYITTTNCITTPSCSEIIQSTNLQLTRNQNHIQIIDVERNQTIWERQLPAVLGASICLAEYLIVCCKDTRDPSAHSTEHLEYRISYLSTLRQLDKKQRAFMRTCYTYWQNNKQPFLITEKDYELYKKLPYELTDHHNIFRLNDAMRKRAQKDFYKDLAMVGVEAVCDIMHDFVSCCRKNCRKK